MDVVGMDHGYSKPWSAHPDASHARPVKLMYMQRIPRNQTAENSKYVWIWSDDSQVTRVLMLLYNVTHHWLIRDFSVSVNTIAFMIWRLLQRQMIKAGVRGRGVLDNTVIHSI